MADLHQTQVVRAIPGQLRVVEGFNKRLEYGDLDQLAESILSNGVVTPLHVYDSQEDTEGGLPVYIITNGHRRYKAIVILSVEGRLPEGFDIPLLVETVERSEDERVLDILLTNDGKNLTMLEQMLVIETLVSHEWDDARLIKHTGLSRTAIENLILLSDATQPVRNKIQDGIVSATNVIELLRHHNPAEVESILSEAEEVAGQGKRVTEKHLDEVPEAMPRPRAKAQTTIRFDIDTLQGLSDELDYVDGKRDEKAFELLSALIAWGTGNLHKKDLAKFFFEGEFELE
ncbi:Spo0J Stage 0 sporulation protein J (antagonist of Soj) containing ParB-like nuclease domain [uncultured Caudovirales phage]|uniref:Spo0J Stage 0 sporulation protein J (Antagonist of Soj) containing ParB-like nuclease domain n=1 Tax=uncultured Caudovirales phage TaxID=2100421 RepID=A0A6J5SQI8_9CAUD|nr:Spo0J Stage 0 sporulation protein J (antagonist of Soj) containing ParB-like nuclease domain [uncultured Caudovirales phage]CAB4193024.1 Spo0J Stage 0 sporulation protein J (antagonist of Soj) containing ParB-like nuclease domain [uncultured Caudovirales phage]CAB4217713.1 Spo0J Stage 0 sporulation protein J (antagonist of Soj) containing ParB-like nuclease domain [uncultured Caudovirales phage]CAB5231529.1 Spo0J Stage 0 sporulation protein J (antagonist of Soj) containing ParB-like nuclease 